MVAKPCWLNHGGNSAAILTITCYFYMLFYIISMLIKAARPHEGHKGVFTKNKFQEQLSHKMCIMPCSMTWNINFWPTYAKNFDFGCFIAQNTAMENIWKIINWHFTGQVIVKFVFWCHNQLRHTRKWGYRAQNYESIC